MKLYYSPGACSLSPHIVSREAGLNLDLEQVDNREKKTKSGQDFWSINPKGQVPVLELDGGQKLTEGPVIVQYLADQKPASGLAPAPGWESPGSRSLFMDDVESSAWNQGCCSSRAGS